MDLDYTRALTPARRLAPRRQPISNKSDSSQWDDSKFLDLKLVVGMLTLPGSFQA
jgi:hypothetical protein